jgi:hypothetical protein
VKAQYEDLTSSMPNKESYQFERIALLFDDRISTQGVVKFRHPSYSESLPLLLAPDASTPEERRRFEMIRSDFSAALVKLSDVSFAKREVFRTIVRHYKNLPDSVKKIVTDAANDSKAAGLLAYVIADNYRKTEEDVRKLLETIAEKPYAQADMAHAIRRNLDNIPPELASELMIKLGASTNGVARNVISSMVSGYNKYILRETVEKILFMFSRDPAYTQWYAHEIVRQYRNLPDFIQKDIDYLSENAPKELAYAIAKNIDGMPGDVISGVLQKTAKKDIENELALILANGFDVLPREQANLLFEGILNGIGDGPSQTLSFIGRSVAIHFALIEPSIRNRALVKITNVFESQSSDIYHALDYLSEVAINHHAELPEEVTNFLISKRVLLAENDVLLQFLTNYDRLPAPFRKAVSRFIYDYSIAAKIVMILADNFQRVPESVRNNLLRNLLHNEIDIHKLACVMCWYYQWLPEKMQKELPDAVKKAYQFFRRHMQYSLSHYYDPYEGSGSLSYFVSLGNIVFVLVATYEYIPQELRNLLLEWAKNHEGTRKYVISILQNAPDVSLETKKVLSNEIGLERMGDIASQPSASQDHTADGQE